MPGDGEVWSLVLDFLTGRIARLAAQAAVLTAVVGGTVAYAHSGKNVTLVQDGASTSLQAGADDVRGLLVDEGVTFSDRDLVVPGLNSPLLDGEQVCSCIVGVGQCAGREVTTVEGLAGADGARDLAHDDDIAVAAGNTLELQPRAAHFSAPT